MTLSAVLFDLDDTLIDHSDEELPWPDYTFRHLRLVLARLRQSRPDLVESDFFATVASVRDPMWTERLISPSLPSLLREVTRRIGIPASDALIDELLDVYAWQPIPGVVPFPGAAETLAHLRESGLSLGLVTNSSEPMWMRDIELAAYGLLEYFRSCRVCSSEVGYLKPHTAMYQAALKKLAVRAEDTVFVGDNPDTDLRGAAQAGIRQVLFRPYARAETVDSTGAVIEQLADLPALLRSWFPDWRG